MKGVLAETLLFLFNPENDFFSGLVMKAGIISQIGVKNFFKHHTVVSKIPITSLDPKSTPIFILLNLAAGY